MNRELSEKEKCVGIQKIYNGDVFFDPRESGSQSFREHPASTGWNDKIVTLEKTT